MLLNTILNHPSLKLLGTRLAPERANLEGFSTIKILCDCLLYLGKTSRELSPIRRRKGR